LMYFINRGVMWASWNQVSGEWEELRSIVDQVHNLRPSLRRGSRVLFLNDPIDEPWRILFLMRLSYRDENLVIDRARFMPHPPAASEIASYDYLFDYRRGRFYSSPQPQVPVSGPEVVYEFGHPAIYHADW